jgi:multicomponent Na+:H+ antiporter subunit A
MDLSLYLLLGSVLALASLKPSKFIISLLILYWIILTFWSLKILPIFSTSEFTWSHYLHLNFGYHIDALARLFCVLISGIGALVFFYSAIYMQEAGKTKLAKLLAILQVFAISMLLLVLTDNSIVLFFGWEMTTITSYLLIQFSMDNSEANQVAFNGMFVSVLGALCMLSAFILLHQVTGTWSIQATIKQASFQNPYCLAAFILLLLGALTKSAQFPFHFWLPGAMQAPTPVSAYLHSATMVNAGIYLLARFHPLFSNLSIWYSALSFFGLATMLLSSIASLFQRDLKAILAYTTLFILGSMVYLLAANSIQAAEAFAVLLFFHAIYKAAAFMWVGSIDKTYHTRDIYELSGQGRHWPLASIILLILMAAMSGLPPLFGFVVKEMIFEAKLSTPNIAYVKMGLSIFASVLIAAASFRIVFVWLFARSKEMPSKRLSGGLLCPLILALLVIVVSVIEPLMQTYFHDVANDIFIVKQSAITMPMSSTKLALLTVFCGFLVALFFKFIPALTWSKKLSAASIFQLIIFLILKLGKFLTAITQEQSLTRQLVIMMAALLALFFYLFIKYPLEVTFSLQLSEHVSTTVSCFVLLLSAVILLINKNFIINMICLAVFGFAMSTIFVSQGAPDVAMTQLLVEILTVIILVIALQFSKITIPTVKVTHYLYKFLLAIPLAASLILILLCILQEPLNLRLSDYFIKHGLSLAHGRNVVNLILVDYRAFDTFGEVMVIVATAFAIGLLLIGKHNRKLEKK